MMYEFHYDYMIPKYARSASEANGDKLKLCYMDTDSLIYSIETKYFYKCCGHTTEIMVNIKDSST